MTQTQWFALCLECASPHTFILETKIDRCIACAAALVHVGGIVDGVRIDVDLSVDEMARLRKQHRR